MHSCDDCPGGPACAGTSLHPVLLSVLDLFDAGVHDKFEILFALGEANESLLEQFNDRVSTTCWSKAALLAIADAIAHRQTEGETTLGLETLHTILADAKVAFARFPWQLTDMVEQAPDLYQAIVEMTDDAFFADAVSKRAFVKICKQIAYDQ